MRDGFNGSRAIVVPQLIIKELEQNPFTAKLHITDIGYYPSALHHNRKRESGIEQYILIYCVNGQGWYKLNGKRYEISADECFVLPAGTPHEYGSSESNPWTIYWIHFKGEFASFYGNKFSKPTSIPPGRLSRINELLGIFEDIYSALSSGYSIENLEFATSALYYFLGSIKYNKTYQGQGGDGESSTIEMAIKYMRENIEKPISLLDLCEYVGYSESHFTAIFKRETRQTPINYMIQLRVQTACQLLDLTDMKVNQLCYKVGINDPYYFSKLFKRVVGVSPSKYRSEKKG